MDNLRGVIKNESPEEHWSFLPVKDKVVCDFGCGINSEFTPTPIYFHNQKQAKLVIGVDPSEQSYKWFKSNYNVPGFLMHLDYIDDVRKLEMYLDRYKPEVVKMDIEGEEALLGALKDQYVDCVKHFAVEYHSVGCRLICETMFKKWGFEVGIYKFETIDPEWQGVMYAYKKEDIIKLDKIDIKLD
jgi:hypothetical protein